MWPWQALPLSEECRVQRDLTENAEAPPGQPHAGPLAALAGMFWRRQRWTPTAVLVLAAAVWLWSRQAGIGFSDWGGIVGGGTVLLVVAAFYSAIRVRPPLAEAVLYAALWVGFSAAGACLTYLAAALAFPLRVAWFALF
jgi:hypothetical protein